LNMLLNHTFISERCVIQREAIVLVQQSGEQCLPDGDGRRAARCLPYVSVG
ncbi:hypothetical protein HMPREF1617_02034, partial [Escherichia coli 908675]